MAVNVDWDVIEGVEDLDKVFKKAIAKADEADEAEIRQQWSESKAEFWERRAQRATLDAARMSSLAKYPRLKGWEDEVRGNTPEEIEASAKRISDRLETNAKEAEAAKQAAEQAAEAAKQEAQEQYGRPAGAGGGTPSRPALEDNEALKERVRGKLIRGEGLQRGGDKMDSIRFQNIRFAEGVEASIRNPSYRSFGRNSPDDKKIIDDRTKRKTG